MRLVFGILSCKWKTIAVQTKPRQSFCTLCLFYMFKKHGAYKANDIIAVTVEEQLIMAILI